MEVHESDRVLWQFDLGNRFCWHLKTSKIYNKYKFLPTREVIIAPELTCDLEYLPWFRVHSKPYLLVEEARDRKLHMRRPGRAPRHPRSEVAPKASPSSTPKQESTLY
ncbi:hypothetical protein Gotur_003631 [Gossypium turneri]